MTKQNQKLAKLMVLGWFAVQDTDETRPVRSQLLCLKDAVASELNKIGSVRRKDLLEIHYLVEQWENESGWDRHHSVPTIAYFLGKLIEDDGWDKIMWWLGAILERHEGWGKVKPGTWWGGELAAKRLNEKIGVECER